MGDVRFLGVLVMMMNKEDVDESFYHFVDFFVFRVSHFSDKGNLLAVRHVNRYILSIFLFFFLFNI